MPVIKLEYKDGHTEDFDTDDYTREELLEIMNQVTLEMRKRDIQYEPIEGIKQ